MPLTKVSGSVPLCSLGSSVAPQCLVVSVFIDGGGGGGGVRGRGGRHCSCIIPDKQCSRDNEDFVAGGGAVAPSFFAVTLEIVKFEGRG